ncbi:MAG: 16S rRNA (adenine(1518)-N(6)/adenine(1519)-N(6))-dimethyltransferase RsmA [Bacilli bacterium]
MGKRGEDWNWSIQYIMNTYGFKFKKSLGQNFIKEESIVAKIADAANIEAKSLVIEIGPGSGMLTKQLALRASQVLAYEIDSQLENILDIELNKFTNIDIIFADFLKRNIKDDIARYNFDHLYLVANLPYYITTPIITKFIEEDIPVDKIVIMVQKEVGERFNAKSGTKEYSSLTVFLNYYFDIKSEFLVSKDSFIPKPNVDSIVISLTKRKVLLPLHDKTHFFTLVRNSFKFKRKNLRNNLKEYNLDKVEQALNSLNKKLTNRAEELTLEDFVFISNYLTEE